MYCVYFMTTKNKEAINKRLTIQGDKDEIAFHCPWEFVYHQFDRIMMVK